LAPARQLGSEGPDLCGPGLRLVLSLRRAARSSALSRRPRWVSGL